MPRQPSIQPTLLITSQRANNDITTCMLTLSYDQPLYTSNTVTPARPARWTRDIIAGPIPMLKMPRSYLTHTYTHTHIYSIVQYDL